MSMTLNESAIVFAVAQVAAGRITRKVISELQQMTHTLSGEDSGLTTTWDEVCVQVQDGQSFYWDTYDETVKALVKACVSELPPHEREALWLQTGAGTDWTSEDPDSRDPYPVAADEIVEYLADKHVYAEADRWSNTRIRAFIERSSMRD
jgi:hypothetical protein